MDSVKSLHLRPIGSNGKKDDHKKSSICFCNAFEAIFGILSDS